MKVVASGSKYFINHKNGSFKFEKERKKKEALFCFCQRKAHVLVVVRLKTLHVLSLSLSLDLYVFLSLTLSVVLIRRIWISPHIRNQSHFYFLLFSFSSSTIYLIGKFYESHNFASL